MFYSKMGRWSTVASGGKIRLSGLRTTNPVAVGDMVILDEKYDEEGRGVIVDIEQRKNYLVRKSTNLSKQMQIMAANVGKMPI